MTDISKTRFEYSPHSLDKTKLKSDPIEQFEVWYQQAYQENIIEPNAMVLATSTKNNSPLQRTVLLKIFDKSGFVFFTNYESNKAKEIAENPKVSILFPWYPLQRQVIVSGIATKISTQESLKYFISRPRGSQIGAWSSYQSKVISSRSILDIKFNEIKNKFAQGKIPLPSFWGGFRIQPIKFEFWQGNKNRLHDRFLYYKTHDDDNWEISRLAP